MITREQAEVIGDEILKDAQKQSPAKTHAAKSWQGRVHHCP
jgi:hypothetical protein